MIVQILFQPRQMLFRDSPAKLLLLQFQPPLDRLFHTEGLLSEDNLLFPVILGIIPQGQITVLPQSLQSAEETEDLEIPSSA